MLQYWEIDRTADGTDFKLLLIPGDRFLNENRARLGAGNTERGGRPRFPSSLEGPHGARDPLRSGRAGCCWTFQTANRSRIRSSTRFRDQRRAGNRHKIANPAGFYIYLVENNFPVPADFETSRKRLLRQALEDRDQRQKAKEAEEALYESRLYAKNIRPTANPRPIANRSQSELRAALGSGSMPPTCDHQERSELRLPEPALHDFAVRRVRESLSEEAKPLSFEDFCCDRQQRGFRSEKRSSLVMLLCGNRAV